MSRAVSRNLPIYFVYRDKWTEIQIFAYSCLVVKYLCKGTKLEEKV